MKRKIFNVLFALVLVLGFTLVVATPVAAATLEVGAGKTYSTITAAITAATAGDTITVYAGTYNAALGETFPIDVSKANLTIQSSAGAATTIIDAGANAQGAIKISAENVTLDGFTIKQGTLAYDASHPQEHTVWVLANYSVIKNNTIIGAAGNQACIYIGGRTSNVPTGAVYGYQVSAPLGHTIQGNTFRYAGSGEGWGIFAYDLSDTLIKNNNFVGDAADVGAWNTNEGAPGTGIIIHKATAAVGVTRSPGGGYVIIENNIAQYVKYTFLTFYAAYMYADSAGQGYEQPEASTVDKVIVRNNSIHDCGTTTGFASGTAVNFHRAKKDDAYGAKGAALTIGTNKVTIGPGNTFYNLDYGVLIDTPQQDSALDWQCVLQADNIIVVNNNIYNTVSYGLANGTIGANQVDGAKTITAENNWWGNASGPTHSGNTFNSGNQGDIVTDSVDYVPWLNGVYGVGTSFAPVKNITDDPDTPFSSIQAAIDAVTTASGETITCEAGTYVQGTIGVHTVHNLTIRSVSGAATTNISGSAGTNKLFEIGGATGDTADGFVLDGFTLTGTFEYGVYMYVRGFDIKNNIIYHPNSDGIFVTNPTTGPPTAITSGNITNNTITGKGATSMEYRPGILLEANDAVGASISGIDIRNNTVSGFGTTTFGVEAAGIRTASVHGMGVVHDITIIGNTLTGNRIGLHIYGSCTGLVVYGNTMSANKEGVVVCNSATDDIASTFTLYENTITGNTVNGVHILQTGSESISGAKNIRYNNISGNGAGLLNDFTSGTAPVAKYNWWGDASGPTVSGNDRGAGDTISTTVTYEPWLTTTYATVYPSGIRYYGYNWCSLSQGWNVWSTPIALDAQVDTWGEYKVLGVDLNLASGSNAYYFNGTTWANVTDTYALTPCDAIYINMASAQTSPILFSPSLSVPSKTLNAGWNLVSASYINDINSPNIATAIAAETALASIYYVSGANNVGYSLVVSPAAGQAAWSAVRGPAINTDIGQDMLPCKGYWVYMINAGTLAGTVFTPVSPLLPIT